MKITLNYWKTGNASHLTQTSGRNIERIYVNDEETGQAIGYFEKIETFRDRGFGSYYDIHRQAKRDTLRVDDGEIEWSGPDGAASAILDVILGDDAKVGLAATWREARERDVFGLWRAMQECARGFCYHCPKRPRTERDKEIATANKARQEAVYEIELEVA